MAPALGLYLDELYFRQYNIKQKRDREQKLADLEVIRKRALSKKQAGQGQGQIHEQQQQQLYMGEHTIKTEGTKKSEATLSSPEGHNANTTGAGDGGTVLTTDNSSAPTADGTGSTAPTGGPDDSNTKEEKEVEKEEVQVSKKVRIDDDGSFVVGVSATTSTTAATATKVREEGKEGHNSEGEEEVGEAEGQVSIICSVGLVMNDIL